MDDSARQIEVTFSRAMERPPTPEEARDLYRMKNATGLRADDPFWMILCTLRHYESRYDEAAVRILEAAERIEEARGLAPLVPGLSRRSVLITACSAVLATFLSAGVGVLLLLKDPAPRSSSEVLAVLNHGGQSLATCFNGSGRLETRPDGTYCYPVSAEGKVFGYRVR